jgi:glutamine synthetase
VKPLRKWVDEGLVDTVIVAGIDLQGRLYGKRCPAKAFLSTVQEGVHTCDCNFGWDVERMLVSGLRFTGWHTGYGDMTLTPDWSTLRMYPWFDKTALVLCDTCGHEGKPVAIAPRTILAKQVARAEKAGFTVEAASELEFFLFRETLESSREKDYQNLQTLSKYISDYSVFRSSMDEWVIGGMREQLDAAGIAIECNKSEWGHGQVEVNLVHSAVREMADRHAIFKNGVREMAALKGVQASFMAKWHSDHSGNGCHIHVSLWHDGKPVFHDPKAERGISKTMRHFLGGLMALSRDFQLLYAPTVNSYKRYDALSFAPINVTWSGDNRTTAYRCIGARGAARIENRIPGADANGHLVYAATIAAGLHGIEHELEPLGGFVEGNAYDVADAPPLPKHLIEAADCFERSEMARKLLGDEVVDHYAAMARWEIDAFMSSVTDWERRRYFELI